MFTGIITDLGTIRGSERRVDSDLSIWIETGEPLDDVAIGASIACSGTCLTVVEKDGRAFRADVSDETVERTVPGRWDAGSRLNLERSLKVGDELGGHIVTGHVDGVGIVESMEPVEGSIRIAIRAPQTLAPAIAPKGSIAVDGVSLTVNSVVDTQRGPVFHVNIIPHTADVTTIGQLKPGGAVNLEIDVLARYLQRMQAVFNTSV